MYLFAIVIALFIMMCFLWYLWKYFSHNTTTNQSGGSAHQQNDFSEETGDKETG